MLSIRCFLCSSSLHYAFSFIKSRIEQSRGKVVIDDVGRGMVNGRLAMTRSIGDLELKRYGVSAIPDVRKIQVCSMTGFSIPWICDTRRFFPTF